ncbi:MAG: NUDIX domain-containing protein [Parcubacteria group bacterium]|jgi:ADP-ribose pyrophosphatase YjhB (NUDIX family)
MKKIKPGKDHIGVGGGVLILNKKGETFLMKRGKNSKNEVGWWNKPGGAVDYGEKVMAAMKRETREEIGVEIDIWGYLPHADSIMKKDGQHWVGINYLASIKSGTARNMEPHKFDDVRWFSLDKLPKKLSPMTREAIKNYLAGKYIKLKNK